jgi:D-glycero-D-manno-heptose 1,7-bisphosphate phosphatase
VAEKLKPAVFLDRDGTISEEMGYLNHVSRFHMFACAAPAVRRINERGIPVIVVTNQSGVARGFFPEDVVQQVNERMMRELAAGGARVDASYYCPHGAQDGCSCRKPQPGLLRRAAEEHGLDLSRSFVVGDRYADVEMAHRVGARAVLVLTGYGRGEVEWHATGWPRQPDHVAEDLGVATDWILREME